MLGPRFGLKREGPRVTEVGHHCAKDWYLQTNVFVQGDFELLHIRQAVQNQQLGRWKPSGSGTAFLPARNKCLRTSKCLSDKGDAPLGSFALLLSSDRAVLMEV